jgi:hypothetical protein
LSALLADIGAAVAAALAPLASSLTYRQTSATTCRAASAAMAGATTIALTLPAGFTPAVGDKVNGGAITVASVAGNVVTLSATLPSSIASGGPVALSRDTDVSCSGWWTETQSAIDPGRGYVPNARTYNLLVASIASPPTVGGYIVDSGKGWKVNAVSPDPTGAVYRVEVV